MAANNKGKDNQLVKERYARVIYLDDEYEREWDFEIPAYLIGKISEGDCVATNDNSRIRAARVTSLLKVTSHSPENIHVIIDKIDIERYENFLAARTEEELLYKQACARASRIEEIESLKTKSASDQELAGIMANLKDVSLDPALA